MSNDHLKPAVGSAHPSGDAVEKPAWAGEGNREPSPTPSKANNINDEPPQDRVTVNAGRNTDKLPSRRTVTDWEWEYGERYGPNEEPTLPWFDRQ